MELVIVKEETMELTTDDFKEGQLDVLAVALEQAVLEWLDKQAQHEERRKELVLKKAS